MTKKKNASHLVFNFPSDFLQRLFLGLGQRQPGGYRVALRLQGAFLLLGERQGTGRALGLAADQRRLYGLSAAGGDRRRGRGRRLRRQEQPASGRQPVVRRHVTALAVAGRGRRRSGRKCKTCGPRRSVK